MACVETRPANSGVDNERCRDTVERTPSLRVIDATHEEVALFTEFRGYSDDTSTLRPRTSSSRVRAAAANVSAFGSWRKTSLTRHEARRLLIGLLVVAPVEDVQGRTPARETRE